MSDVLHINVEPLADSLERAAQVMEYLEKGESTNHYNGVGFSSVENMLSLFTLKRWELIETLRNSGEMSINGLAKELKRNYKNVHTDVMMFIEWGVVNKNEQNLVYVPYNEFIFDVKLSEKKAA
jgi:predicted transcriptional regulator